MAVPLARRNLFESLTRLVISVGGVALAMVLVLILDGVFAGAMRGVTAYIDSTPFDIVISQEGVRNLHMTSSQFPISELERASVVPGVARVDPILFTTAFLVSGDARDLAYLIGVEPGKLGGPQPSPSVPRTLRKGDIVIDERIATERGLTVGDTITVLGRDFRLAGLVSGTVSITNSVAFIRFDDFEAATGLAQTASFGLVKVKAGEDPATVAARIRARLGGLTVQTKAEFADSERRVISDMSTDILRIMSLIGFLIGLAVVGLTVYTATLSKVREYGVLKALGTPVWRLFGVVIAQAIMSAALGLVAAIALAFATAGMLQLTGLNISVIVEATSIGRVAAGATAIALLASVVPIARVWRIEPANVLRR